MTLEFSMVGRAFEGEGEFRRWSTKKEENAAPPLHESALRVIPLHLEIELHLGSDIRGESRSQK